MPIDRHDFFYTDHIGGNVPAILTKWGGASQYKLDKSNFLINATNRPYIAEKFLRHNSSEIIKVVGRPQAFYNDKENFLCVLKGKLDVRLLSSF